MSRDRLAASRAQRAAQAHEMSALSPHTPPTIGSQNGGGISDFFSEIVAIQHSIDQLNANVAEISALHARLLNVVDGQGKGKDAEDLDSLTAQTRSLSNGLKDKIKALEGTPSPPGQDVQMRRNRIAVVRSKFLEAIQNYQRVEQEYRSRARQRVERQLKIVKPDATQDEVGAMLEGEGQQIFMQALSTSGTYGASRQAYNEVQERQQSLKKMEQTLGELAQLFSDMGTLVQQQDEAIDNIQDTARGVEDDTENAGKHVQTAVKHARSYRKGRWLCFWIFLIFLVVAAAIILGVVCGSHGLCHS